MKYTTELESAEIWWYKQNNRREFYDWLFESGSDLDEKGKEKALDLLAEANYMFRLGHFDDVLSLFISQCTRELKNNKLNLKLHKGNIVLNNNEIILVLE